MQSGAGVHAPVLRPNHAAGHISSCTDHAPSFLSSLYAAAFSKRVCAEPLCLRPRARGCPTSWVPCFGGCFVLQGHGLQQTVVLVGCFVVLCLRPMWYTACLPAWCWQLCRLVGHARPCCGCQGWRLLANVRPASYGFGYVSWSKQVLILLCFCVSVSPWSSTVSTHESCVDTGEKSRCRFHGLFVKAAARAGGLIDSCWVPLHRLHWIHCISWWHITQPLRCDMRVCCGSVSDDADSGRVITWQRAAVEAAVAV